MEWAIFFTIVVLHGGQFYFGLKSLKGSEPSARQLRHRGGPYMQTVLEETRRRVWEAETERRKHPNEYAQVNWKEEGF